MMETITELASIYDVTELVRVVWMEVAMASFAATMYFTFSGWLATSSKKANQKPGVSKKPVRVPLGNATSQEQTAHQLVTKALRQGNVKSAITLIQELPEVVAGCVPANLAPRFLMALAKSADFDDVMSKMEVFIGKFELRSLDAAILEAVKRKDVAACRQLLTISRSLSIPRSLQTLECLARMLGSDSDLLRSLVEEAEAPLSRAFAKAALEACTVLKEVDLAAEVFEKVADTDEDYLRCVVEKAATAKASCVSCEDNYSKKDKKEVSGHWKEQLKACGKDGDLEGAMRIFEQHREHIKSTGMYNSMIDVCVECGSLEKAVEYFGQAKDNGWADAVSYNIVMKGYLAENNIDAARSLIVQMSEKSLAPTIASYHAFLNFYANAGKHDSAWKVVKEMQAAGVAPTSVTCTILLKQQAQKTHGHSLDKVLALVDTIDPIDEVLFHALAEACIHAKNLSLLSKYQAKLLSQGDLPALTAPTYGSMIKAYGQVRDVKHAKQLWDDMVFKGVQPTAITLGCMVEALVANRCTADAWKLVQELRNKEDTRPLVNTVIYSTILKGFANAKDTDKVMALYEEMKANEIQPNTITYNTILNAFALGGAMDRLPSLLQDMKNAVPPAEPDIVTYSTIVKGYCNSGSLDQALKIVKDMQSDGNIVPDEVMYNSLLDGCAKEHRPNDAIKLLDDMRKNHVAPSNYTLSMIVKLMGRCRRLNQAFSIIEDLSREYGLKVNIQVYTCLIQACFNNRQATKAVALHDQILKEGLLPDEMTYSALVKGCVHASLLDKAVQLTRCAYGLTVPLKGTPPGINSRTLDELVSALGGSRSGEATALLGEIRQGQTRSVSSHSTKAPWRQNKP